MLCQVLRCTEQVCLLNSQLKRKFVKQYNFFSFNMKALTLLENCLLGWTSASSALLPYQNLPYFNWSLSEISSSSSFTLSSSDLLYQLSAKVRLFFFQLLYLHIIYFPPVVIFLVRIPHCRHFRVAWMYVTLRYCVSRDLFVYHYLYLFFYFKIHLDTGNTFLSVVLISFGI